MVYHLYSGAQSGEFVQLCLTRKAQVDQCLALTSRPVTGSTAQKPGGFEVSHGSDNIFQQRLEADLMGALSLLSPKFRKTPTEGFWQLTILLLAWLEWHCQAM
jgi:hypothetical protein